MEKLYQVRTEKCGYNYFYVLAGSFEEAEAKTMDYIKANASEFILDEDGSIGILHDDDKLDKVMSIEELRGKFVR